MLLFSLDAFTPLFFFWALNSLTGKKVKGAVLRGLFCVWVVKAGEWWAESSLEKIGRYFVSGSPFLF